MRDKRFIAEHRGGRLKKSQHLQLINWARNCLEHIFPILDIEIDYRLINALQVAKDWEEGKATVGDARKASINAHAAARESTNPIETALARAVGHTVATAHMADHALGGALYVLKALKLSGRSIETEKKLAIRVVTCRNQGTCDKCNG